jgi:hypothetical protein
MLNRVHHAGVGSTLILCAVCSAAGLAGPPSAVAGAYTAVQCSQSLSPTTGQAAPERTSGGYSLLIGCMAGTGLQVSHGVFDTTQSGTYGRWVWRAPTGTIFTNLRATASLVSASGEQARLEAVRTDGQTIAFGAEGGAWGPADQLAGEFTQFRSGLRCTLAGGCPAGGSAQAAVRDVFLNLDDRSPPVPSLGGSPFEVPAVRGEQPVELRVTDAGGGVRAWELRVNDALVDGDALACRIAGTYAIALQPCGPSVADGIRLQTGAAPFETGVNRVTACATDLALSGLANTACLSDEIFVDDLCPPSSVGGGSTLSASFAQGKDRATVRSNRRLRLDGRLTSESGEGIAGATVCALTRTRIEGGPYEVANTAETGNRGRYSMKLPPGPNRAVFVHRVFGNDVLAFHRLSANSTVRPTFVVRPGRSASSLETGDRLRFKGRLPGPGCARRVVKVQAKVGKRRWQVFRGIRTDRRCTYKTRYKLRATSKPTRYHFRVRVPAQPGYPYKAGTSAVRARRAGG